MSTRARAVAGAVAICVAAVGCTTGGDHARQALTVRVAVDARRAIRAARLTRAIVFDHGELRLSPIAGKPIMSESAVLALYRAGSPPTTIVRDVSVVYARATLGLSVSSTGVGPRPDRVPAFSRRPVWAVMWRDGPHHCDQVPARPRPVIGPEPQSVLLIAADGTAEGAQYSTRGSFCAQPPSGPSATVTSYFVSMPWKVEARTGTQVTMRFAAPPPCGYEAYAPELSSPTNVTLSVFASVLMAQPPCSTPTASSTIVYNVPAGATLQHIPSGFAVGRFTTTNRFTYFDGTMHTLR